MNTNSRALLGLRVFCTAFTILGSLSLCAAEPRKVAILVGVNRYENRGLRDLEFAERDVDELAALLKTAGYEVSLLTTTAAEGRYANLANIRANLNAALAGRTKDDLVLIGLAGHGFQIEVPGSDGVPRADSFFCPTDALAGEPQTMLSIGKLIEDLDKRGGGHNLLMIDACREDPTRGRGLDGSTVKSLPAGVAVLFGCDAGQKTYETDQAGGGHGVFFHFVIEGLKGAAKNDVGEVTWSRLSEYVSENVELQTPALLKNERLQQTPFEVKNIRGRSPVLSRIMAGTALPNLTTTNRPASTTAPAEKKVAPDKYIEELTALIARDPTKDAYNRRGIAWMAKGEIDKALVDFSDAIRVGPPSATLYTNRATASLEKGDYRSALSDYTVAISMSPSAGTYINRGNLWFKQRDYEQALADYNKAIELDSKEPSGYVNRANTWLKKEEFEKAIADFETALQIDPNRASTYSARAWLWQCMGEYDKAIADCNEVIRINPKYRPHFRGILKFTSADFEGAVGDFNEVLNLSTRQTFSANAAEPYACILGYLAASRLGEKQFAQRFLDFGADKFGTIWPSPILDFLNSKVSERTVMLIANDKDKQTEAHCYLGIIHLIEGRASDARTHFEWVRDQGNAELQEYLIAAAELKRLNGK